MTYLTDLRRRRDKAAKAGDHATALILNDRIRHIKEGNLSVETSKRIFEADHMTLKSPVETP